MDTLLQNGDFAKGSGGYPLTVQGTMEMIQRVLIRLSVRRGSFPLDPGLGSDLYRLRDVKKPLWEESALLYAKEALAPVTEAAVQGVSVRYSYEKQAILLDYRIRIGENTESVVVTV